MQGTLKPGFIFLTTLLLASLAGAAHGQEQKSNLGRISLPSKTWGVVLNLPGFEVKTSETKPDGRRYFVAGNESTGVVVSVFLEEADPNSKNQNCRENLVERLKAPATYSRKDSKLYEKGGFTFLEFLIPEVEGVKVRQKNLVACLVRDNVYIDFHFSKTNYQSDEERLFFEILDTLQFQENIQRTSMDYLQVGSVYYLQHDYKRAIPAYAQALELEKRERRLDKTFWYVLVDNLGMAYALTRDPQKAKETFEYGVSQDSTYPLFYYNLACTYAEMNDIESAKTYLTNAFQYKQNTIPGEGMPDPRKDDSFRRYLKDKEFKKFLDSLMAN